VKTDSPFSVATALDGRSIVVTRPREQSLELSASIKAAGGRAILFPTLTVVNAGDRRTLNALIDRLDQFAFAIFISPTAANRAMKLIRARRELPMGLRIAAIGKGSARELRRFDIEEVLTPERRFDSEGLLALAEFADVKGRSIVIFRGEGGREQLGNTLMERGATIEYAECYRRVRPNGDASLLLKAWGRGEISAITVTSTESLRNLFDITGTLGRPWLRKTPMFVPHERIAELARELGIATVVVTAPGDAEMLEGMIRYFGVSHPSQ